MGDFRVLQLDSVRQDAISEALRDQGIAFDVAAHVAATNSLARAITNEGSVAVSIATLLDLVVMPGLPGGFALTVDSFPQPPRDASTVSEYQSEVSKWQAHVAGRRMRMGVLFDDILRKFRRRAEPEEVRFAGVVYGARRSFAKSIQSLIAAGFEPGDVTPNDPLSVWAVKAWAHVERELPALTAVRQDLWIDWEEFEIGASSRSRALRDRINQALEAAFGKSNSPRTIVHHGFYFYTPPQWALFQLLRRLDGVHQIFVVHDDGSSPVFGIWRQFFAEQWSMPEPWRSPSRHLPSKRAAQFLDALGARPVRADASQVGLRVLQCGTPTEFVRQVNLDEGLARQDPSDDPAKTPKLFASDAATIERYCSRLGTSDRDQGVNLLHLPIGAFLLRLHDGITVSDDGHPTVALNSEAMADIVLSGFLPTTSAVPHNSSAIFRRTLPFFRGITHGDAWIERAKHLEAIVLAEVPAVEPRNDGANDFARMEAAVSNPLRTVPWADLTIAQVRWIRDAIEKTVKTIADVVGRERVRLAHHFEFVSRQLRAGMNSLPAEERAEIEAKLAGFDCGLDEEIDVEGLVDIVAMLLGRSVQFDAFGEDEEDYARIKPLRNLDSLGFRRSTVPVHVANLAETSFPAVIRTVGWPFRMEQLAAHRSVSLGLLRTREHWSALGDLYLLWLALDGVIDEETLTLSWMSKVGGEQRNPSSLLGLLVKPDIAKWDKVLERVGGIDACRPAGAVIDGQSREAVSAPPATASAEQLKGVAERIDRRAAASAVACRRRFALQWAMGDSTAFLQDHQHGLLFGNVIGALKCRGIPEGRAVDLCINLWRNLSIAERASSLARSVVVHHHARPEWILTLSGAKHRDDPLSLAYQTAIGRRVCEVSVLASASDGVLPPGFDGQELTVCQMCPIRPRCAAAVLEQD